MSDTSSQAKTVLVTGSSRGLGKAIAAEFAQRGHTVAVHYVRSAEPAEALVADIQHAGGSAQAFQADVADASACARLVKDVQKAFGGLDIVVNNAGITKDGLTLRMKEDAWQDVINTNLSSAFFISKAALRPMMSAKWGRIVNIASVVGLTGNPGQANYVAAKAGLIGLTKTLAKEYATKNITVNAVAPGFIVSDMTDALDDSLRESYLAQIPMGRFGVAKDVANAVAFLASDAAAYITGQTLTVDGGLVM
ncbi:MAG: 3-oxoacyl-[acyl-carrier-protein] reductase [Deinococcota bacterium]